MPGVLSGTSRVLRSCAGGTIGYCSCAKHAIYPKVEFVSQYPWEYPGSTLGVPCSCAKHAIYPKVEIVPVSELNRVYAKLDADNESGTRVPSVNTAYPCEYSEYPVRTP